MIRPILNKDGTNNWSEVDWDNPDIGEYTNLCPDKRRADFEYGSICIVETAKRGAIEKFLPPYGMQPSKVKRELDQLSKSLEKVSPIVVELLAVQYCAMFRDPISVMKELVLRTRDSVIEGHGERHIERRELGSSACSIWISHGGDIQNARFSDYVARLLENSDFLNEDDGKRGRVNVDNIVREIRRDAKKRKPENWDLWGA